MAIQTIYKVIVRIPDEVWERFHDTTDYDIRVSKAIEGYLNAGADFYSKCYEWATFSDEEEAIACEKKLLEVVRYFKEKL